jgi:sensor c-di-GMP phosphodiesterase-like protein
MSVLLPRTLRDPPGRLFNTVHVLGALAAALIPLAVFMLVSYRETLSSAEAKLADIVQVARQRVQEILHSADRELARYVQVTERGVTPEARNLLREIVYRSPYFREGALVDGRGLLVYSTAAPIEAPVRISSESRADPAHNGLQVLGLIQSDVMQERSIVFSRPTKGQGEVKLLLDPNLLSMFFQDVDLGPDGSLFFIGPKGGVLSVLGPAPDDYPAKPADTIRATRTTEDGLVTVVGDLKRSRALRGWYSTLTYSLPVAAACSLLLAFTMLHLVRQRSSLDHDLRQGMRRGELRLEYQPIIDLRSGRCVAAEALLRWQHPAHGHVRPDVFIPLAEQTGLIAPLTEWVVRRVLLERHLLLERDPDLRLSINCASSLVVSRELEEILRRVVPEDLARNLVLEVTESVFAGQDADSTRESMSRLRRTGFRFALDDFGAGYSGLGYLQRFEFEFLKIDRSFVQAIGSGVATSVIFDTLVDLARKLDLVTVAEGVETEEQCRYVDRRGIALAQGWLFAMPMPAGDLARFLAQAPVAGRTEAIPRPA